MDEDSVKPDEYDFDSSDEEDIRNTIGNVPIQWYESLAHLGYDTSGRPIMKPNFGQGEGDDIDKFLEHIDANSGGSSLAWRAVRDPSTGQVVILSDKDLQLVNKMASFKGVLGDGSGEPYEPWNEWFSKDVLQMPVTAQPPHKRSFVPSALDRRRVGRMVHAIKMGWIQPRLPAWALTDPNDPDALRRYALYMTSGNLGALDSDDEADTLGIPSNAVASYVFPDVWSDQDRDQSNADPEPNDWRRQYPVLLRDYRPPRPRPYQKAPDEPLPGHIASYNPPPEFILSKEEQKQVMRAWRDRLHDGHVSRVPPQMPQKFDCLRHVPFSERYLREREERVKDLVMAARVTTQRLATTPDELLPPIPSLAQLRPYPSHSGIVYSGHRGRVTSISVSPCGQWLASISPADGCLRIWETSTNYCFRCYQLATPIQQKTTTPTVEKSKPTETENESNDPDIEADWHCDRPTACVMWNPKPEIHLLAAAIGTTIFLINPALGDRVRVDHTDSGLRQWWSERKAAATASSSSVTASTESDPDAKRPRLEETEDVSGTDVEQCAHWSLIPCSLRETKAARSKAVERSRVVIQLDQPVCSLDWHPKGDYLLSLSRPILSSELQSRSAKRLLLHRLSTMSSQSPFASASGSSKVAEWKQCAFHPAGKPQLFVASSRTIAVYDLVEQCQSRCLRLDTSGDCLSCMALHVSGDHVVAGTFDGRFNWFDVDLGNVPFKKLGLQHGAVRQVDCHKRRPLVSAALDDGNVLILHATVPEDLMSKPVIIPVQLISTGQPGTLSSVFATCFHPRQPHVYTGGADGSVRQFVPWR